MERHSATPSSAPPPAPYEPNAILRWLYRRFFAHIHVDERWSGVVGDAARRGVVVYVMRSLSLLDFLCLDWLVKRFGLPLVRFVNDLGLWILEPFGRGGRRLRLRRPIPEDRALSEVVRSGASALLFLRRLPRLGRAARKGQDLQIDLIRTLVETQRQIEEPVLLVPQTFVWSKLPARQDRSLLDLFFGPSEWPGRIRVFLQFLLNYRNALLRSGEPFDLRRFLEQHPDLTDGEIADKVRYALLRRIERERTVVLGPTQKSPARIREELMRSPRVRKHIESEARASRRPLAKVEKEARKELRKLCANQDPRALGLLARLFDWVWNRIYDGLEVDKEGIERLRQAAREGPVVLLPSHKSHVDYLILSFVLYVNALSAPLIAAGDNLSFWPLGPVLRRAGGFFIKRSFRGSKLYAALVDAYLRKLMVEGFPIEFFIEGGRSRTGKLLPPKYGLLSMVVDAALLLHGRDVRFVPISIGYERIIEQRSYVHELSGGEKERENIGGLLKTPQVLRSKYGRLYVQFGELLSFEDALAEGLPETAEGNGTSADPRDALSPTQRRLLVQRIAHRAGYEINRVTVVTPASLVATALLVHRRRGMAHSELVEIAGRLLEMLDALGARIAGTIRDGTGGVRDDILREAVSLFLDGKLLTRHDTGDEAIYAVPEERRIGLEYYKNTILHFFVPSALIASALVVSGHQPISVGTLRERVRQLSRVFKYEFMYRADATFGEIFDDALAHMLEVGELERIADHVRPAEGPLALRLPLYREMLRTYFESYRLAARASKVLLEETTSRKDWIKRALALGQRMYLAGEIEQRESLSKSRLEGALLALRDHGLVRFAQNDGLRAGAQMRDEGDVREAEQKLAAFLRG